MPLAESAAMQIPSGDETLLRLKSSLSEFVDRLRHSIGDDLISVVLFGGAARGHFDPAISDANVMLVLREASLATLDKIASAAEPFRLAFKLSLLTVTEGDLGDSVEVFPTKFLDIQRHHELIWGRDVASALAIPKERLQRQALRQLMNLHLRLRQVYLEVRNRPEQLDGMIRRSLSTLLLNLGILLELRSGRPCETTEKVLSAAESAGFDAKQIAAFTDFKYGRHSVSAADLPGFYDSFMRAVAAALTLGEAR
jgi:hypothetical protein